MALPKNVQLLQGNITGGKHLLVQINDSGPCPCCGSVMLKTLERYICFLCKHEEEEKKR